MSFKKDSASTFVTRFILFFVGIFSTIILARLLGPLGKGQYELILLIPSLFINIGNLGIDISTVYFIAKNKERKNEVASNSVILSCVLGISCVLLAFIVVSNDFIVASFLQNINFVLVIFTICLIPLNMISGTFGRLLVALNKFSEYNLVSLFLGFLTIGLMVIFVVFLKGGVVGAVLAYAGSVLISFLIFWQITKKVGNLKFAPTIKFSKELLSFGIKGHLGNLIQFLNYRLDMFIVVYFIGPIGVGLYSIAVALAEKLWLLPGSLGMVLYTKVASSSNNEINALTTKACRHTLFISVVTGIILAIAGESLIRILFGDSFLPALKPLWWLLPGAIMLSGAKILGNDLCGRGYPILNTYAVVFSLAVNLPLNIILIPEYGISGAAISSSVAYILIFIITVYQYSRISGVKIPELLFLKLSDIEDYRKWFYNMYTSIDKKRILWQF